MIHPLQCYQALRWTELVFRMMEVVITLKVFLADWQVGCRTCCYGSGVTWVAARGLHSWLRYGMHAHGMQKWCVCILHIGPTLL